MQKRKLLTQEEKEKLSSFLVNNLGWNELTFCFCDKRSINGLYTTLKVDMISVTDLIFRDIKQQLNVFETKITAENNTVVLEWI